MKQYNGHMILRFCFLLGGLLLSSALAEVEVAQAPVVDDLGINKNQTFELDIRIISDNENIRFEDPLADRFGNDTERENHVDGFIKRGVARLGLNLERIVADRPAGELNSIVLSPTSIGSVLALVLLGSGGKTFVEVANVLGLTAGVDITENTNFVHKEFGKLLASMVSGTGLETSYGNSLKNVSTIPPTATIEVQGTAFASAIFLQKGFPVHARFMQNSQKLYRSQVLSVDFNEKPDEAKDAINRWVAIKTMGRISKFLSFSPSRYTKVLLATALYFNGEWEQHFPVASTRRRMWNSGKSKTPAWMMTNAGVYLYGSSARLGAKVVALPYRGRAMSMYFVLPNESGSEALHQFINGLTVDDIDELANNVNETELILSIPRFKIESTISLKEPLLNLGLATLFEADKADLSYISPGVSAAYHERLFFNSRLGDSSTNKTSSERQKRQTNPGLYADDVIHKVELEVTETGTVASAATAIAINRDGSRKLFVADRPFLFFIRHEETGLILFWGRLLQPNHPKNQESRR